MKSDEIREKIKKLEGELKKKLTAEKGQQRKNENKKAILYAAFRKTCHMEEYERDISSPEFGKFLTRDYERALFGFKPDGSPSSQEGEKPEPEEKRIYLYVPFNEKEDAKKKAKEIFGAEYRKFFDFDKNLKRWFLLGDTDTVPFAKWLSPAVTSDGGLNEGD